MQGQPFDIREVIKECSQNWCKQDAHFDYILFTALDPSRLTLFVITCQNPYQVRIEDGRLRLQPHWRFDEIPMDGETKSFLDHEIGLGHLPPLGKGQGLASGDDKGVWVRGYITARRYGVRAWKPSILTHGPNGLIAPWQIVPAPPKLVS